HSSLVYSVTFSVDGRQIPSGGGDNKISEFSIPGRKHCGGISGHADAVRSVSFSPDGTRIASGSRDKTARLWDAATGQLLSEPLEGHTEAVWSVSFSPDGTRIASGLRDKTMRHWDAATGRLTLQAGHHS
ncbi:hypothetical protein CY34DRAFT_100793, partial [Suillus luteus UH-Slu-Lm8-n1]